MTEPQHPRWESTTAKRDKVLIQYLADEFVTKAGLLIGHADIEENKVRRARVVSVGEGAKAKALGIKREDVVRLPRNRGWELPVPAGVEPYVFVDHDWIEGVEEDD